MSSNRFGRNRYNEDHWRTFDTDPVGNPFGDSRRASSARFDQQRYGIIILGNSGVGKSFIANLFVQQEVFEHKSTPTAVTKATEYVEYKTGETTYLIFNIPGLVEANQSEIDVNKEEIYKAFDICPNAVVFYVFGNQNGRIRNEDVIAFNALHDAYSFDSKSLVLVVNGVPSEYEPNFEGETIVLLKQALKMNRFSDVCFFPLINKRSDRDKGILRQRLMQAVLMRQPKVHEKQHDIQLDVDLIKDLTKQMRVMQERFEHERNQFISEFRTAQKEHQNQMEIQRRNFENVLEVNRDEAARDRRRLQDQMESQRQPEPQQISYTESDLRGSLVRVAVATTIHPFVGLLVGTAEIVRYARRL